MKLKALIPIFLFLLGVCVVLFLVGLKSRMYDPNLSTISTSTTSTTFKSSSENRENNPKNTSKKLLPERNDLSPTLLCARVKAGLNANELSSLLSNNGIVEEKIFHIRKNVHIQTRDDKNLRLIFKNNSSERKSNEMNLVVLEEKENDTFDKVDVPKELKLGPALEKVLAHYQSENITYQDEVKIYQDDQKEIIFETIDGKIATFNMTHKDSNKSFNCNSESL